MQNIFETILDMVWRQYETVKAGQVATIFADLSAQVRLIAGIGALVYIFSRMIGDILRGDSIDFFPYLRPFLLVGMIALTPSLCDLIDELGKKLYDSSIQGNYDLANRIEEQEELMRKAIRTKFEKTANNPIPSAVTSPPTYYGMGVYTPPPDYSTSIGDDMEELGTKFKAWLLSLIQDILLVLMQIAEAALILISIGYRLILRVAAPVVFVAAIFPGMSNGLGEWFSKYINYALMPFVATIIGKIAFGFTLKYLKDYTANLNGTFEVGVGAHALDPSLMGIAFIGLLVCCLLLFFQVPSLTQMFIQAGGVSSMVGGATSMLNQGASAAGSVARPVARAAVFHTATTTAGVAGAIGGALSGGISHVKDKRASAGGAAADSSSTTARKIPTVSVVSRGPGGSGKTMPTVAFPAGVTPLRGFSLTPKTIDDSTAAGSGVGSLGTTKGADTSGRGVAGSEPAKETSSLLGSMWSGAKAGYTVSRDKTADTIINTSRNLDALGNFSYGKTTAERLELKLRQERLQHSMLGETGNVPFDASPTSARGGASGGNSAPESSSPGPSGDNPPTGPTGTAGPSFTASGTPSEGSPPAPTPVNPPPAVPTPPSATPVSSVGKRRVLKATGSHSPARIRQLLTGTGAYASSYNRPVDATGKAQPMATPQQVQDTINPVSPMLVEAGRMPTDWAQSRLDWSEPSESTGGELSEGEASGGDSVSAQSDSLPSSLDSTPTAPPRTVGGFFRAVASGAGEGVVSGAQRGRDQLIKGSRWMDGIRHFSYMPTSLERYERQLREEQNRKRAEALNRSNTPDGDSPYDFNNTNRNRP